MENLFVSSRVRCPRCRDIKECSEDLICWRCAKRDQREISDAIAAVRSLTAKHAYYLGYTPLSGVTTSSSGP